MRWQELQDFVRANPFRPFRLRLTTGQTYDVTRASNFVVGVSNCLVFRPTRTDLTDSVTCRAVAPEVVAAVEYLDAAPAA